jgi:uncharacterized membrane protein (DUF485 family)
MDDPALDKIQESRSYAALVKARALIIWPLSLLIMVLYFSFILVIAFVPELFAIRIGTTHFTLGIAVGLGMIVFTFLLTGFYVLIANRVLEPLAQKLQKEVDSGT